MRRKRSLLLSLILVAAPVIWVAKKMFDYSAAPEKDKESDYVFPANPDQEKTIVLASRVQPAGIAFAQQSGFINDASHLNRTAVYGPSDVFRIRAWATVPARVIVVPGSRRHRSARCGHASIIASSSAIFQGRSQRSQHRWKPVPYEHPSPFR